MVARTRLNITLYVICVIRNLRNYVIRNYANYVIRNLRNYVIRNLRKFTQIYLLEIQFLAMKILKPKYIWLLTDGRFNP